MPVGGEQVQTTAKLGAVVRAARHRQGLTQAQLADRAGVGRRWVISLEAGDSRRAELGLVLRLLDALGLAFSVAPAKEPEGHGVLAGIIAASLRSDEVAPAGRESP